MTQKAAARAIGTNAWSLRDWEENRRTIRPLFLPGVIAFLGYDPRPAATTLGELIRREHLARGWSLARLAAKAQVDPATIRRIEMDTPRLGRRSVRWVSRILGLDDVIIVGERSSKWLRHYNAGDSLADHDQTHGPALGPAGA